MNRFYCWRLCNDIRNADRAGVHRAAEHLRRFMRFKRVGSFHSIPDTSARERLVTTERACKPPETEVHMSKMKKVVRAAVRRLNSWSVTIVVILSLLHIGLAYIHARESGRSYPI